MLAEALRLLFLSLTLFFFLNMMTKMYLLAIDAREIEKDQMTPFTFSVKTICSPID